jgi:hypothetical protein
MGPNHITLRDGGATCGVCGKPNPLANMRRMTMLDLTEPRLIGVPWTRSGTAAHALSTDGKTALGPWITFSSAETFERERCCGTRSLDQVVHTGQYPRPDLVYQTVEISF